MKNLNKKLSLWLPVLIWAVIIFTFSSVPTLKASQIDWQDFIIRKTAHLGEYAIFAILIKRALDSSGFDDFEGSFYSILLTILYAFSDEFHQSFTPGREPAVRDVIIDTVGATIGVFVLWKLAPLLKKLYKNLSK